MKNVTGRPRRSSSRRMRGTATAPNSPREIDVGVVMPRWIHSDGPSKSNERQRYPAPFSMRAAMWSCSSARVGHDQDIEPDAELRGERVGVSKDLLTEPAAERRVDVVEAVELDLGHAEERTVDASRGAHAGVAGEPFELRHMG